MVTATDHQARVVRAVQRTLADAHVQLAGRSVLALCSGGADSVAAVHLLASLPNGTRPRQLQVLHLDHGLRVPDSAELAAAAAVCERHGLTLHHRRCAAPKGTDQGAARTWRYATALTVARELGCEAVATGHHEDDLVETILLSLFGSGSGGQLRGMHVKRRLSDDPGAPIDLLRPLLALTHDQLVEVVRGAELPWWDDAGNRNERFARARVRTEVIPSLLAAFPDAGPRLIRAARRTDDLARALDHFTGAVHAQRASLQLVDLEPLSSAAQRAVITSWLGAHLPGRDLTERSVRSVQRLVSAHPGASVDLNGGCVGRDRYGLHITVHPSARGAVHE